MEVAPRSQDRLVQRLRYQFRMSGHLQNALRPLFTTQAPLSAVPFFSTKEVVTDDLWRHDVLDSLQMANAYFMAEADRHPLYVGNTLDVRVRKGIATIALRPFDQQYFDGLVAPLSKIPSLQPERSFLNEYYTQVDADMIQPSVSGRELAVDAFKKFVSRKEIQKQLRMERVKIAIGSKRIPVRRRDQTRG
jgi:hypothetical protein